MMTAPRVEDGLHRRLERLTGEEAACCVPEYRELAKAVRRSPKFPTALRQVKALADENRLLAVSLLKRKRELCACEIQAATGLTHATVSHHMAALVESGLVEARREGKWTYYRLRGSSGSVIP